MESFEQFMLACFLNRVLHEDIWADLGTAKAKTHRTSREI